MSHKCSGFVCACMDWRIQHAVGLLVAELTRKFGHFDRVQIAGGAGNRDLLLTHVELSNRLHAPDVFVITGHADCGFRTTKADLVDALAYLRAMVEPEDTVIGYWFEQEQRATGPHGWTYTEVSPLP